ncbi:MAG: PhzF family phenazine biosynthesis protein [Chloroflexi bacterium]|nr:PhzF family phenazine biosynthesis protein [Chloroflexota bacterium]
MRLDYHLLDVFTEEQFGGNQLAVFPDPPEDLSPVTMQQIARELNLSEVTYLFPPVDQANDYRLRIFTPAAELPMAGHPTVGTAFALAHLGGLGNLRSERTVVFEEGIGPITVTIEADADGRPGDVWMRQPLPQFGKVFHDRRRIAEMLSLDEEDLLNGVPLQVLSSGLPFLFVPVRSLEAVKRAQLRQDRWLNLLAGSSAANVFITTPETVSESAAAHSRMFAPALGVSEDPATGSATGPLGAYLLKYGLAAEEEMICEQGFEMGRPSIIRVRIERDGSDMSGVAIGGRCAYMGYGTLLIN